MMSAFDAVVIGAGNGGLTASAAMAQKGLKVLLLERHHIPGGCATSFVRGRFEFEVALHQLSGLGRPEKPGPTRFLLDALGVTPELEFVEMDDLYRVVIPGGFDLVLPADRQGSISALQARFPAERDNIERFFDLMYRLSEQFMAVAVFRDPQPSPEKYPFLYKYSFRSAKEVLDEFFDDELLKAALAVYWGYLGVSPTRLAFVYLAILFYVFIEFKPFHIKGGSQAMSNALLNKFLENGGTARLGCGARKIVVENGAVTGVITEQGDRVDTRFVVSNASTVLTYLDLIGAGQVPRRYLTEMRGRGLSASGFVLFMGLDCEPARLGVDVSTTFVMSDPTVSDRPTRQMHSLDIDQDLMVLSCYNVADPDFSPPGTSQMSLVTLKFGEPWLRVPPAEYFQTKYRVADGLLRVVEKVHPGIRDYIEEMEVATPLTHMRYLGHPQGAIYGFEQQTKDSLFFQPGRHSGIGGLYFASGWSGDCGFQATLEAGRTAANSVIRKISA
jgi:prolycopene isomerase